MEQYKREHKEQQPVLAICYDFDKTLSPDNMQAQGYIQSVGYDVDAFWKESDGLAGSNDMDQNLAYMLLMKKKAQGKVLFTRKKLEDYGARVSLFPGVEEWFERIRAYGAEHGVIVEHYILSSGLKEMIEGTSVAQKGAFKKIYASAFYYDADGVAEWPAQVVNYTNKTQFLFRIQKGVLDINDPGVNDYFPPDKLRVPFRNMVYIGDSDTDVPCMKLVNQYGGYSIGVYSAVTKDKSKVYKMMRDNRIRYFAPADYSPGTELDAPMKAIIDRTVRNEALESKYFACKGEQEMQDAKHSREEREKAELLLQLGSSESPAYIRSLIEKMLAVPFWTEGEREALFALAAGNGRLLYHLRETQEARILFERLLEQCDEPSAAAQRVLEAMKQK